MRRDFSQPSVASTDLSVGLSEPSVFERELPQNVESLAVEVPRGLRTHGSVRLAGQMRSSELKVPTRRYNVTVEPGGRARKPKEAIRESTRLRSGIEMDLERSKAGDPAVDGVVDDRFIFKRERLKRFEVGNHFPALVSPRLVPSWKLSAAGKTVAMEQQQAQSAQPTPRGSASPRSPSKPSASLSRPTVSHCIKQSYKRSGDESAPWQAIGAAGAHELICNRKPTLHSEHYDTPRHAHKEESQSERGMWVSDATMLPTSAADSKGGFDANRPQLDRHISAMRERGRAFNESLKERYEILRENFQRERAAMIQRQGGLSTFEKSLREKEAAEAAQQATVVSTRSTETKKEDAPAFMGLGLGGPLSAR